MGLERKLGALNLVTFIVLAFCYSLFVTTYVFNKNITDSVNNFSDNLRMSIYLKPKLSAEDKLNLEKQLKKIKTVNKVEFISSKKAHEQFAPKIKASLKQINLGQSLYLPASFDLQFFPGMHNGREIFKNVSSYIKSLTGVEEVVYAEDVFSKYASFRKTYFSVSSVLWLLIIFTCILVVGNMVRASVSHREREIEILEFIGATSSYIMKPYILRGAVVGFLASALALLSCSVLCFYINQQFEMGSESNLIFMNSFEIVLVLLMGTLLSIAASALSFMSLGVFKRV